MRLNSVLQVARPLSECGEAKLVRLWDLVQSVAAVPGAVVEIGVYRGGSGFVIASATAKPVYLCDTFCGTPDCALHELDDHRPGNWLETSVTDVRHLFANMPHVVVEQGIAPAALPGEIAFAHIDVDMYQWTLACAEAIWLRMSPGGVLVCDDYEAKTARGAKAAIDEWLATVDDVEHEVGVGSQLVIRKVPPRETDRKPDTRKVRRQSETEADQREQAGAEADESAQAALAADNG